ncbi:MAG: ImmA/IrrE family metallo-endopeptidase [Syntrophomonadaceae bacterium]|nr:ImmA/IrrE family metallo-endopeptidase [Syntrophomonadaceae bacterium]MDD4561965.1 ImmA/IrrE family metallo-endopeptidase [Syntrophomonadaceae bacterium]
MSRAEYQARKWAALELMPLDMVKKALASGVSEVWELAEEFGVTEDVVRFRMGLPDVRGLGLGIE